MSWGNIEDFSGFQEPEESQCSAWQMSIIESLLVTSAIDQKEKDLISASLERFSEKEAFETIQYLKENNVETDPRQIWVNNIKRYGKEE